MTTILLNHVVNGVLEATVNGALVLDLDLVATISPDILALSDDAYYKLNMIPPGVGNSDAVNVAQLNAVSSSLNSNIASLNSTINTQAVTLASLSSTVGAIPNSYVAGDYKTSAQNMDHGKWLLCDGRAVSRTTYQNLYNILGTTFGVGDGSTTFNLPNPQGRSPVAAGQGATVDGGGLGTLRQMGQQGGFESHALTISEMPSHSHTYTSNTITNDASLSLLGTGNRVSAQPVATSSSTGGGAAHSLMHPFIVLGSVFIYIG